METNEQQQPDVRGIMREVVQEFLQQERTKAEPAYKAELVEERKRREQLEGRLNELVEENRRTRAAAEESDRNAQIRSELQRLGVAKIDLAFKAVKDDVQRTQEGRLVGLREEGVLPLKEYLTHFVQENPELLPARIGGGSGAGQTSRGAQPAPIDLDRIKPGMSSEELDRVRQEILRVAGQSLKA